MSYFMMSQ